MPTLDATVGGPNANSYLTLDEAAVYFDNRIPITPPWAPTGDASTRLLITGTRTLNNMFRGGRTLVKKSGGDSYYIVNRKWRGQRATSTQRLDFPRTGLVDGAGNPVPSDVIPEEIKFATAELSGQLGAGDRTLDSDVVTQGIKSVSAGSVSVSFKDDIATQVLPDAVVNNIPPWWYDDETIDYANSFEFEVI